MIDVKQLQASVTDGSQAALYLKQLANLAYEKKHPFQGTFELTPLCNFTCPMCYVHLNKQQAPAMLSTEQWLTLAQSAMDAGTIEITLTGGEPLLHPGFREIYKALHKMGMIITIMSNASLMDEDFFQLMAEYPPRGFSLTIYGNSPETYQKVCGHPEAYETVKRNILRIRDMKNVSLRLKTTVIRDNVEDIPGLLQWAEEENLRYDVYTFLDRPRGETGRCVDQFALTEEEELRFWQSWQSRLEQQKKFDHQQYAENTLDLLTRQTVRVEKGFHCTAAASRYWINWKGQMLPCAMFDTPCTDPLKTGIAKAYQELNALCAELPGLGLTACKTCDKRGTCRPCPASHYLETGEYGVLSQRICRRQKLFMAHQCYFS